LSFGFFPLALLFYFGARGAESPRDCVTGKCLLLPVAAATEAAKTTAAAKTAAEVLPRRQ